MVYDNIHIYQRYTIRAQEEKTMNENMTINLDIEDDEADLLKIIRKLKNCNPGLRVLIRTSACEIKDIHVGKMTFPGVEKLKKYREYYEKEHKFAHAIVVDENNYIRDGYTTYIIANELGVKAEVVRVDSSIPHKKVVIGRHVTFDGENYCINSSMAYRWFCKVDEAVVPGDILLANTQFGKRYMIVEKIDYVVGEYACSRDKSIKKCVVSCI